MIFLSEQAEEITGCLGGILHSDLYSAERIASELFWFVRPGKRGDGVRLYHAFEDWAREQRCNALRMVHLLDVMPAKVAGFYRRSGFVPVETHYSKTLNAVAEEAA